MGRSSRLITDNMSWPWIFFNQRAGGHSRGIFTWLIYRDPRHVPPQDAIDAVGLVLLVLWSGALQVMLDTGKDLDWFRVGFHSRSRSRACLLRCSSSGN